MKFDNIHSNTYATGGILTSFGIALIRVPCGMLPVLERIAVNMLAIFPMDVERRARILAPIN